MNWLGTSLGGLIGISLAGIEGTPIRRLIVNDVAPEIPHAALRRITSYVGLRETLAPFSPMTDPDWEKMERTSVFQTASGLHQRHDPAIVENFRRCFMFMHFNIWKYWEAIPCPVLVLRGTESDFLTERLRDRMCERLPHAKLAEFENVEHVPSLNSREQIAVIENWLRDTRSDC